MWYFTKRRILFDILFWTFLKGYELVFYTSSSNFEYAYHTALNRLPAELILYYAGTGYILPVYFAKKNLRLFILQWIIALILATMVYRIGRYYFFPNARINNDFLRTVADIPSFFVAPFYFMSIPALGFIIFIFRKLHNNELQKKESDKHRVIAEMKLLKAQIQPHFLFNTLNNLYSLALSSSANTADSILRLSKIMEYMLYNSEREKVSLGLEMQYVQDYVELEKLRYGKRLQVSWDVDSSLSEIMIVPLLLFPFIENAFKHGSSKDEENTWITISLKKEDQTIVYIVVNSIPALVDGKTDVNGGKYGLQNLNKRLNLGYPGHFSIIQTRGDASFMSVLRLDFG